MTTQAPANLSSGASPGAFIEGLLERLESTRLPSIDFDELKGQLGEMAQQLADMNHRQDELQLLRQDYQARIAGMLKAVAVAARRQTTPATLMAEIERLPSLSAAELVAAYGRAAARFRDTFRSSFAPIQRGGTGEVKPQEYK